MALSIVSLCDTGPLGSDELSATCDWGGGGITDEPNTMICKSSGYNNCNKSMNVSSPWCYHDVMIPN